MLYLCQFVFQSLLLRKNKGIAGGSFVLSCSKGEVNSRSALLGLLQDHGALLVQFSFLFGSDTPFSKQQNPVRWLHQHICSKTISLRARLKVLGKLCVFIHTSLLTYKAEAMVGYCSYTINGVYKRGELNSASSFAFPHGSPH